MWRRLERIEQKVPAPVKRHWLTIAFLLGFALDTLTLNNVEQLFDNLVLAFYVTLAMVSMLFLYLATAQKLPEWLNDLARRWTPLLVQFSFGGLLSGMLIFYGRSGDLWTSWPFLLLIITVIYFNETLKERASRLIYNLAILFVGLFSYVVLLIPVLTGYMGAWVFVGSGFLALCVMYGFVRILYKIVPHFLELNIRTIIFTLGGIFVGLNVLYFTNIIPPIPLSLQDVGIYHSVVRFENGDYQLTYETGSWWQFFKDSDGVFHPDADKPVFCFARVFVPTRLTTDIYHTWEYKNAAGEWIRHYRGSYSISGGAGDGYRGYTQVQNFRDGQWRCSVETRRGQVLGREYFEIDGSEAPSELITRVE